MDLPEIGSHCSLPSCKELDLLPIRCLCGQVFCRHHISTEVHDCPAKPTPANTSANSSTPALRRCTVSACNKVALDGFSGPQLDAQGKSPAACPRCQLTFCVDHRHPSGHNCTAPIPAPEIKNQQGRELLAKYYPPGPTSSKASRGPRIASKPPADQKKKEQYDKIQLMRMRHTAVPADPKDNAASVSPDQRLHIRIRYGAERSLDLWFRKSISTGKALDLVKRHLHISAGSATLSASKTVSDKEELMVLQNDKDLVAQVADGQLVIISEDMKEKS